MYMKAFKGVMLGAVMLMLLSGCGAKEETAADMGNTDGNISNLGSVCCKDGVTYYQNSDDGFSIYKDDGKGEPVKLNSGTSYFINVMGDYVYYVHEDSDFHIYRMKLDGSENTEIIPQTAYYMTVYGDKIYYADYGDGQNLYRADLDGKNAEKIVQATCYYPIIAENMLYYVDYSRDGKIVRANLDGTSPEVIDEDNPVVAAYLNYDKGKLYYTNAVTDINKGSGYENNIMCYDLVKQSLSTVIESPCADLNVYNDRIYYSDLEKNCVYSCKLDGTDIRQEYDKNGIFLNTGGNKLYCFVKEQNKEPFIETVDIK